MLWQRRHFIVGYATARNVSMYTEAKLGQLWQVLTPLLNAGVYYLIFGLLFEAARGVAHYPAFLVTGVFVFAFTERSIVTGSNVMRANLQLIRALYFPRASLPLAYVIVELQQMLVGMVVVAVVMLVSGQYPTWYWLLLIPADPAADDVQYRGGADRRPARRRDGRRVRADPVLPADLPLLLRRHVPDHHAAGRADTWEKQVLSLNPFAVFISLIRVAFMSSYRAELGRQPALQQRALPAVPRQGHVNGVTSAPAGTSSRAPGCRPGSSLEPPRARQTCRASTIPATGPLSRISNIPLQAYCHAIVTNNDLWIAAAGWGIVIFLLGIVFFWQAENLYGRG